MSTPAVTVKPKRTRVILDAFSMDVVDCPGDERYGTQWRSMADAMCRAHKSCRYRGTWQPAIQKVDFLVLVVDASAGHLLPLAREVLDETLAAGAPCARVPAAAGSTDLLRHRCKPTTSSVDPCNKD